MDKIKLQNTIDTLSRLVTLDENKRNELIEKFSKMDDKDVIKELSLIAYRTFCSNEDYYNYALTVTHNINPEICPFVEEMKKNFIKIVF